MPDPRIETYIPVTVNTETHEVYIGRMHSAEQDRVYLTEGQPQEQVLRGTVMEADGDLRRNRFGAAGAALCLASVAAYNVGVTVEQGLQDSGDVATSAVAASVIVASFAYIAGVARNKVWPTRGKQRKLDRMEPELARVTKDAVVTEV